MDIVQDVIDFHRAMGLDNIAPTPSFPSQEISDLKLRLVREEFEELVDAILHKDLVKIADSCTDLIYVVIGLALAYGIDLRPAWSEIQRSNMSKKGGERRADGKLLKPAWYSPPDLLKVIEDQPPLF